MRCMRGFLLARLLGVEDYGLLGIIIAYSTLVGQFGDLRTSEAWIHFGNKFLQQGERRQATALVKLVLTAEALMRSVAFLVVMISVDWVATWLVKTPQYNLLFRIYALYMFAQIPSGVCSAILRVAGDYKRHGQVEALVALLELLGCWLVFFSGGGLTAVTILLVLAAFLQSFAMMVCASRVRHKLRLCSWRDSPLTSLQGHYRTILRFLFFTGLYGGLKGIHTHADTLVVGGLLGAAPAGCWRLAKQFIRLFTLPQGALHMLVLPEFARVVQTRGPDFLRHSVRRLSLLSVGLMLFATAGFVLLGPRLVSWVAGGSQYADALPAIHIMLIGVVSLVPSLYAYAALIALGNAGAASKAALVGVFLQLAVLATAVPWLGVSGAAWAFVAFAVTRSLLFFQFLDSSIVRPLQPNATKCG
jgi:O-antigen/teichoic acid export membrane protein